ncbi:MAG TPA: LysM peptidoglycan-binding domain-containing protein [Candidatus Lumbricidophila sp.]|nr:LysM peptidoglycan-binding domain-containing protein [Candidatus Lumbricidophila sp.]
MAQRISTFPTRSAGVLGVALLVALTATIGVGIASAAWPSSAADEPVAANRASPVATPESTSTPDVRPGKVDPSFDPDRGSDPTQAPKPQAPTPAKVYVIQRGDTLSSISALTGISVQRLAAANGIADVNLIFTGSSLALPVD